MFPLSLCKQRLLSICDLVFFPLILVRTALAPDICALGGEHHIVGYGDHVHEPAQALVAGEFSFVGTLVGQYSEL